MFPQGCYESLNFNLWLILWTMFLRHFLLHNADTLAAAISMKIINNITHYLRCGLRGASG